MLEKFLAKIVIVMGLIFLTAIVTPFVAKFVDKIFKNKSKPTEEINPENYQVKDIYEGDKNNENNGN